MKKNKIILNNQSTFDEGWKYVWEVKFQFLSRPQMEKERYINHIKSVLGDKPLDKIKPADIEKIKKHLIKNGLTPGTIQRIVGIIRRTFNVLNDRKIINMSNPVNKIKIETVDNWRHRFLTVNESQKLLDTLRDRSLTTWRVALLSLSTGLRSGEIFALKGDDIDLQAKSVRVLNKKIPEKNRIVYLPDAAFEMIADIELYKNKYVFTSRSGQKLKNVSLTFFRIVDELGLNTGVTDPKDKVVFHTLRHTYAAWLIVDGQPLHVVGTVLGLSSLEMTKRYIHLIPKIQKVSLDTLDSNIK